MSFSEKYNRAQTAKQQSWDEIKTAQRKVLQPIEDTLNELGEQTTIPNILRDAAKTLKGQTWMKYFHDPSEASPIDVQVNNESYSTLQPSSIAYLLSWDKYYICLEVTNKGDIYFLQLNGDSKLGIFYEFASNNFAAYQGHSNIVREYVNGGNPAISRSQWEHNPEIIENAIVESAMNPQLGRAHPLPSGMQYMLESIYDL